MIPLTTSSAPVTSPPPVVSPPAAPASNAPASPAAVAPSFSIAPASNNARGNNAVASAGSEALAPAPADGSAPRSPTAPLLPAPASPLGSANFLAQLIGQDTSPGAQTVLVEYEKLVYLSTIKYKPSDALRPQAQPSDVFSRLVSDRKNQLSSPAAIVSFLAEGEGEQATAAAQAAPAVLRALRQQPREEQVRQAEEEALATILENTPVAAQIAPLQALGAYTSSAARISREAIESNPPEIA